MKPLERLEKASIAFLEATKVLKREKELIPIEKTLEKKMAVIFRKQGKAFIAAFEKYSGLFTEAFPSTDMNSLFDGMEAGTAEDMTLAIKAGTSTAYTAGIDGVSIAGYAMSFTVKHPDAMKWLEEHAAEMVTKIDETTRETIGSLVTQGMEEGWSYGKTAKEITSRFEEFAVGKPQAHIDSRAHLVAVTESGNAYEQGARDSMDVLRAQGLEVEKSWNTVGDDLVTDECLANEAEGWIPIDDEFSSGDLNPLRFPGCRCNCTYQVAGAAGAEVA